MKVKRLLSNISNTVLLIFMISANIGIVTGKVSKLVAIDVDPRHRGGESLARVEYTHARLPNTIEA